MNDLTTVQRLSRDLADAAKTLTPDEARFCVDISDKYAKRFYARVNRLPDNGCWEWTGGCSGVGYGIMHVGLSMPMTTNRVAWILANGAIPDGRHVLHHCDNRLCVRPDHLFLGTHQDNMADKMKKGRHKHGHLYGDSHPARSHPETYILRGERHRMAKLTWDQVNTIRLIHATRDITHQKIAEQFGVSRPVISSIIRGATWKI